VRREVRRRGGDQGESAFERFRHDRPENRHVAADDPHQHSVGGEEELAEAQQQRVVLRAVDAEQIVFDRTDAREVTTVGAPHVALDAAEAAAAEARAQQDLAPHEPGHRVQRVRDLVERVLDEPQRRDPRGVAARDDLLHQRPADAQPLERGRDGDRAGAPGLPAGMEEAAARDLAVHRDHDASAGVEVAVGVRDDRADGVVGDHRSEAAALVDVVERVAEDRGDRRHVARGHVANDDPPAAPRSPEHHRSPIARCRGAEDAADPRCEGGRPGANDRWIVAHA